MWTRPELALTPAARDAYRLVLLPPMPTWVRYLTPAQPAWGGLAALSVWAPVLSRPELVRVRLAKPELLALSQQAVA